MRLHHGDPRQNVLLCARSADGRARQLLGSHPHSLPDAAAAPPPPPSPPPATPAPSLSPRCTAGYCANLQPPPRPPPATACRAARQSPPRSPPPALPPGRFLVAPALSPPFR
eukprot:1540075-Rhodomonas_salina.6